MCPFGAGRTISLSLKPARRRELARWTRERFAISVSQACWLALATFDLVSPRPSEGSNAVAHAHPRNSAQN